MASFRNTRIYLKFINPLLGLDIWKVCVLIITAPLFSLFVANGRATPFIENISNSIVGQGSAMELMLDGMAVILTLVSVIIIGQTWQAGEKYKPLEAQVENHPALARIILPSHINEAYLTQEERAKIAFKREEEDANQKMSEKKKVSELLGVVPGFAELLEQEQKREAQTRAELEKMQRERAQEELENSLKEEDKEYIMQQQREEQAREAIKKQMLKSIHDPSRKNSYIVRDISTLEEVYSAMEKDENVLMPG
jgi:hypothetical protein